MRVARARWSLLLGALLAGGATTPAGEPSRMELTIEVPEPGAVVGDPTGLAFISGKALALYGEFQSFDLMFVVDASDSTSAPSGADIDGDGKVGHRRGASFLSVLGKLLPRPNTDDDDSVLAAEIAALDALLDQLDPRTTRVGVVVFSGDRDVLTPDAHTQVPLTSDYERVRRGLDEVLDRGPHGMTNMAIAVDLATAELLGTRSAYSERREGARRIMIFLTDGHPTLPFESSPNQNARTAIKKAHRAAKAGIRIDTYAIGEDALKKPVVVVEMARVTGGAFFPILHPKDLRSAFEEVSFAEIEALTITNRTTGKPASHQIQNPDGSFSALVPMREGRNTVEVFARATDGSEARRRIQLEFLPEAGVSGLSPRQIAQRNRLLENHLLSLQRRNLRIQAERDEELRRGLEIEVEREKAQRRAEDMRKELELEVENR